MVDTFLAGRQKCFAQSDERYSSAMKSSTQEQLRQPGPATNDPSDMQTLRERSSVGEAFQQFDFDLLANLWLARGFQVNFIYNPVYSTACLRTSRLLCRVDSQLAFLVLIITGCLTKAVVRVNV